MNNAHSEYKPLILTIEDDFHVRSSFRHFLEDCDYRVLEASNGRDGLELVEEVSPDLVLVDLIMPEMAGLEVLEHLSEIVPDLPVVVVSGTGCISDVVLALRKGAWDYLLKPLEDLEVLRHVVERGLERARLIGEHKAYQSKLEEKVKRRTLQLERANAALKAINQRIDLALTGANIGMWDWHIDTGEFILDQRLAQMLGHAPCEISDKVTCMLGHIHPQDLHGVKRALISHLRGGASKFECEYRYYSQSGDMGWFLTRGMVVDRDKSNHPCRLTGTCLDITDRKNSALALMESETRFRMMIEHNPVPMIIANPDQELEYCNQKFTEIFGYKRRDFKNLKDWRSIISDSRGAPITHRCVEKDKEVLEGSEFRILCRSGEMRYVELRCMLLGRIIVVAIHDITQMKSTEERILQFNKELEKRVEDRTLQLVAAQEELMDKAHRAGMAVIATDSIHNIGNILNSVNVSIEEMGNVLSHSKLGGLQKLSHLLSDHEQNLGNFFQKDPRAALLPRYLTGLASTLSSEQEVIQDEISCLVTKFNLMRDVVMTQQNYAKMNLETVNASIIDIVEDALRIQAPSLSDLEIRIHRNYRNKLTATLAKAKLVHVVTNLIKNSKEALKDKPKDGKPPEMWIRISKTENGWGEIRVTDNGCGIHKSSIKRIFNHGFTTKKNGFGFGLHSCANLMAEMGGHVLAESNGEGKGATFIVKFPLGRSVIKKRKRAPTPSIAEVVRERMRGVAITNEH